MTLGLWIAAGVYPERSRRAEMTQGEIDFESTFVMLFRFEPPEFSD
jgi:hypothetical protein